MYYSWFLSAFLVIDLFFLLFSLQVYPFLSHPSFQMFLFDMTCLFLSIPLSCHRESTEYGCMFLHLDLENLLHMIPRVFWEFLRFWTDKTNGIHADAQRETWIEMDDLFMDVMLMQGGRDQTAANFIYHERMDIALILKRETGCLISWGWILSLSLSLSHKRRTRNDQLVS